VSEENVVATIEDPSSHHGMLRPERKNSVELFPARQLTITPIASDAAKNTKMTIQSMSSSCMG
jgi:hypothetical protein